MSKFPFQLLDWSKAEQTNHKGLEGNAIWHSYHLDGLRIRLVEYSANYIADHWCQKGHIVHCIKGSFISEDEDGSQIQLEEGMSYVVSNDMSSHRSISKNGAVLFIIDGDFLE